MKRSLILIIMGWLIAGSWCQAQEHFPVNGVQDDRPQIHAFTNATIVTNYQTTIENASLLIHKDKIVDVGNNISVPDGAIIHDLSGKYIYPAFIDLYAHYGMPEVNIKESVGENKPQLQAKREGPYAWNDAIKADFNAVEAFTIDEKQADAYRKQGFGTVLSFRPDGIARGTSVLVTLADQPAQKVVLKENASTNFSFKKGTSKQNYPNSLMGSAALIRQTFYDAEWYATSYRDRQKNLPLQSIHKNWALPQIYESDDKSQTLLAAKIGKEFDKDIIIKGQGDEYQRISDIKNSNVRLIVPLNFPKPYDVEDPYQAMELSLAKMKHWEMAPANPRILDKNDIDISLTAIDTVEAFLDNLKKTIQYGFDRSKALKALTYNPAQYIGVYDQIGSLEKGKVASFFISTDDIFNKQAIITQSWIQGKPHNTLDEGNILVPGNYNLNVGDTTYSLIIKTLEQETKYELKVEKSDTSKIDVSHTINNDEITFYFKHNDHLRFTGWIEKDSLYGKVALPGNSITSWHAAYQSSLEEESKPDDETPTIGDIIYPFTAYGWTDAPEPQNLLFKNTTVWTNEQEGILNNADVLIKNGKIVEVGKDISSDDATVIDGTGKHLTSGIIDEHSHIALFDVNEASQSVTSEVRMEDVVNSEDINIYRQLAGGVTASQLLHGSANPIGGQSAIVKMRWGASVEDMIIDDADPFIKFALGENVKQSNWGDQYVIRYPQTRMGVEQVYEDAFTRAIEYMQKWNKYNALSQREKSQTDPPGKDLELEALVEILNSERFITCHSYIQSEINMLMKVAEKYGFNINTFTHILEGYKLADKMKEHGAAGSTFSDWWAYKFEVKEAIPYNAALMNNVGVLTAINSDDAEMGRRLNQEAAKTVKYGGTSQEEAWKMVTLNPAKMLHLDHRMGSIKAGKDADLVLWSHNPLSIYAKAEKTIVDGKVYFDIEKDKELRTRIAEERNRLIQKMLDVKQSGAKTQEVKPENENDFHCDD